MKKTLLYGATLFLLVLLTFVYSCKEDEEEPEVIASFSWTVTDPVEFKTVTFTNESQNFSLLSWDFGDGSALSSEANPVHTFASEGEYNVKLTATSLNGSLTDVFTAKVTIADPNTMLTMLVGDVSKTWKLIRDVSTGRYPLEVGPIAHNEIWWALGRNEDLAVRPCMLNDEWTFGRDMTLVFDDKGDYWAEGSIYPDGSNNACFSSADPMLNKDGTDVSAWASGNHTFGLTAGREGTLKIMGLGAFIGLQKAASTSEVTVPQEEVIYTIVALTDATTDSLILDTKINDAQGVTTAYWRFVLVHYDNPADEPPIPDPLPVAGFTYALDGLTVTFTNTSTLATSYLWDFGDGATSSEMNPVHTYGGTGIYTVTLTASNANGSKTASQTITIASGVLTEAVLTAGAWKIQVSDHSIYVGPGMGSDGWWITPLTFLDGTMVGTTDDWSCMADDEFIFSAGGGYEYKTNGSSRNDGYMGSPNGCWSDAEIAASPGAPFGSCATHTFAFTPATPSSRAIITLTNGPGFAAFIGFMKGYYGGENSNNANPPNGGFETNQYEVMTYGELEGKEIMVVTVDLTADHSGTSAWTMTLERTAFTEDKLIGDPWKIQVSDHSIYVGPGMGSDGWWITPLANLDGTNVGTSDDWSCMADDEFIFYAGGGFEYKTMGGSRNDGYMGSPNGCWTDAEIAASPGAPFGSCNTHTWELIQGGTRPVIKLTNGPGFAAFIGFMKGYYGGENSNNANPPNGGSDTNQYEVIMHGVIGDKEILVVSVDLTADHTGTSAWTMTMERAAR